jgi:response regulator NasT
MINVIILFPKVEIGKSIKSLLVKNGIEVTAVCSTGAQTISAIDTLDDGLIICGYQYVDMMYYELQEYLPPAFEMLLLASQNRRSEIDETDIVCMGMPFKAYELVENVNYMLEQILRRRKRHKEQPKERSTQEQAVIEHAKIMLMDQRGFTEQEAHRYLQKESMDQGQSLVLTARYVLDIY